MKTRRNAMLGERRVLLKRIKRLSRAWDNVAKCVYDDVEGQALTPRDAREFKAISDAISKSRLKALTRVNDIVVKLNVAHATRRAEA